MTLFRNHQLPFLICLLVTLISLLLLTRPRNDATVIVSSQQQQPTHGLPRRILEVGLPRSGSLAIHQFFACQSHEMQSSSLHYCCEATKTKFPCHERTIGETIHQNALNEKPLLQNCGADDETRVYTALHVEAAEPYDYPDAVWILPQRQNAATWATSVLHWHSETQRFLSSFEASRITKGLQVAVEHAYDPQTHAQKKQQLMGIYDRHTQKVRTMAQQHNIRLVEINIDDPHAGALLQTEFPSLNSNCWSFDASALDEDWKNLTLPF